MDKKLSVLVVLGIILVVTIIRWSTANKERADAWAEVLKLRTELEVTQAAHATGPCGSHFSVALTDGRFAVAGRIVTQNQISDYYLRETAEGTEIVKKSGVNPGEYDTVVVRRSR